MKIPAGNFHPKAFRSSGNFQLQPEFIRDHGDELAVGGLAAAVMDGVAEVMTTRKTGGMKEP